MQFTITDAMLNAIKFPYGFSGVEPRYSMAVSKGILTVGVSMVGGIRAWVELPVDTQDSKSIGICDRLKSLSPGDYTVSITDQQIVFVKGKSKFPFPIQENSDTFTMPSTASYDGSIPLSFSDMFESFERVATKVPVSYPLYINPKNAFYPASVNVVVMADWEISLNLIGDMLVVKQGLLPMAKYFSTLAQYKGIVEYTRAKDNYCTFKYTESNITYYLQLPTETPIKKRMIPTIPQESFAVGKDFWDSMKTVYNVSGSKCQSLTKEGETLYITEGAHGSKCEVQATGTLPEDVFIYSVEDTKSFVPLIPMNIGTSKDAVFYMHKVNEFNITVMLSRILTES